jgi:hypothetical protein
VATTIASTDAIINIPADQDADFEFRFQLTEDDETTAIDLTGYSALMQARDYVGGDVLRLDLSSDPSGGIQIGDADPSDGWVIVTAPDSAMSFSGAKPYDIRFSSLDGTDSFWIKGKLLVSPTVTRAS